jgi:hypothetical protein
VANAELAHKGKKARANFVRNGGPVDAILLPAAAAAAAAVAAPTTAAHAARARGR